MENAYNTAAKYRIINVINNNIYISNNENIFKI